MNIGDRVRLTVCMDIRTHPNGPVRFTVLPDTDGEIMGFFYDYPKLCRVFFIVYNCEIICKLADLELVK